MNKKEYHPKFKVKDFVKYNGNIYQITNIVSSGLSEIRSYDVKCVKNNFPDEPICRTIGMLAESDMQLVDFCKSGVDKKLTDLLHNGYEDSKIVEMAVQWIHENARTPEEEAAMLKGFVAGFKEGFGIGLQEASDIYADE